MICLTFSQVFIFIPCSNKEYQESLSWQDGYTQSDQVVHMRLIFLFHGLFIFGLFSDSDFVKGKIFLSLTLTLSHTLLHLSIPTESKIIFIQLLSLFFDNQHRFKSSLLIGYPLGTHLPNHLPIPHHIVSFYYFSQAKC